jgi:hypothetical protein
MTKVFEESPFLDNEARFLAAYNEGTAAVD